MVIYSEKDEFDKLKAPPQKTVKRWVTLYVFVVFILRFERDPQIAVRARNMYSKRVHQSQNKTNNLYL